MTPEREKQPASESLQKWTLFTTGLIFSALAFQNIQMTNILVEIQRINDVSEHNAFRIDGVQDDINELQRWRHSQPFRPPTTPSIPKVILMPDRRIFHLPIKPPATC